MGIGNEANYHIDVKHKYQPVLLLCTNRSEGFAIIAFAHQRASMDITPLLISASGAGVKCDSLSEKISTRGQDTHVIDEEVIAMGEFLRGFFE